ncbi:RIP metalloprotease RseP, partial [bacterium]|nr:RIP metalloprotease RseP [bacterium]
MTILYFAVTLGLLIAFHEFGHFWVARRCGVKVHRFSIGFGPALLRWRDRFDTDYVLAAIPLGGYVKMLDEREGPVDPAEQDAAFNRQSAWARAAIVSAGPLANFILAIAVYWVVMLLGVTSLSP